MLDPLRADNAFHQSLTRAFLLRRRALEQPLLSFSAEAATLVPHAVQRLLAEGMQQLQQLGAGGVFSLELGVMPAELHNQGVVSAASELTCFQQLIQLARGSHRVAVPQQLMWGCVPCSFVHRWQWASGGV